MTDSEDVNLSGENGDDSGADSAADSGSAEKASSEMDDSSTSNDVEPAPNRSANPDSTGDESLARYKAEASENYDRYIRAVAELENFKKRSIRERADLIRYAGEGLARDLLEVVDNLQRALAQELPGANEELVRGIQLTLDRFISIMEQHSIKGESSVGLPFDPTKHEALASVPTGDFAPGTVMEEYKRAYFFRDKLLRPAQVVVSTALD